MKRFSVFFAAAFLAVVLPAQADTTGLTLKAGGIGLGFSARSATPVYIGAGAGVYDVSIVRNYGGPASIPPFGNSQQPATTANGVGGKIFAGTTFAKVLIFEAGYHIMPQAGGTNTNAITAQFGVRF